MNKDIRAAMLGDHEAAKRVTDAGVMIPCPGCGKQNIKMRYVCGDHFSECIECGWTGPMKNSESEARLAWNTRAPILSESELKKLEETI